MVEVGVTDIWEADGDRALLTVSVKVMMDVARASEMIGMPRVCRGSACKCPATDGVQEGLGDVMAVSMRNAERRLGLTGRVSCRSVEGKLGTEALKGAVDLGHDETKELRRGGGEGAGAGMGGRCVADDAGAVKRIGDNGVKGGEDVIKGE